MHGMNDDDPHTLELRRDLVFHLIETSRLLHAFVDERARRNGTTRAQWAVLGRLRREEGITQAELAAHLELQPISLVRLLDRLVDQGLVERRNDPHDRRAKRLYLTDEGRAMVHDLAPLGHALRAEILDDVSADEMRQANDFLVGMKNRLKQLTQAAHEQVTDALRGDAAEGQDVNPTLRKRSL
jgi:MarR family transcriptional regulator, transcriptional regulator for hemolysin